MSCANTKERDDSGPRECFRKDCGGHVTVSSEGDKGRCFGCGMFYRFDPPLMIPRRKP